MKYLILTVILALLTSCSTQDNIHIPDEEILLNWGKARREWPAQRVGGIWETQGVNRCIIGYQDEYVPDGDDIESWKEVVVIQNIFTRQTVDEFIATWKMNMSITFPDLELQRVKKSDVSSIYTYQASQTGEYGIMRFSKGSDGIYIVSYRVRSNYRDDSIVAIWNEIIEDAKLYPNHQK